MRSHSQTPLLSTNHMIRIAAILAISVVCVGCSKPLPKGTASVRGFVTFRGLPVASGTIVFTPDRDRGSVGKLAAATLGTDGSYQLQHLSPGWYRISISDSPDGSSHISDHVAFPAALRRPDLAGLERELKSGDNAFDFLIELTE